MSDVTTQAKTIIATMKLLEEQQAPLAHTVNGAYRYSDLTEGIPDIKRAPATMEGLLAEVDRLKTLLEVRNTFLGGLGYQVIVDDRVPPGEVWLMQEKRVVAKLKGVPAT